MQKTSGDFLEKIEQFISLTHCDVLEIGCGDGVLSELIAAKCAHLVAIDPSIEKIEKAKERNIPDAEFFLGTAEKLDFSDSRFDLVIFTLSFHHIPIECMNVAIGEARRVVKESGHIVYVEPTNDGSFFDAEALFDAGEERVEKIAAYESIHADDRIMLIGEFFDETIFHIESANDFIETMMPKKNVDKIEQFLVDRNYILTGERRISIFRPTEPVCALDVTMDHIVKH